MRFMSALVVLLLTACSGRKSQEAQESYKGEYERVVAMELEAQKHVGMQIAPAQMRQLTEYLQVTGTVQPIDSRVGHIRPLSRARILEVTVRVGDRVMTDQALARIDNIEASEIASGLASAQAELRRLRVQHAALTRQVQRNRRLVEIGAAAEKDLEASVAEQKAVEEAIKAQESTIAGLLAKLRRFGAGEVQPGTVVTTPVRSPFAGVITQVEAAPGDVVDSEDNLFTLVDLSRVWVQAEVYEKDLGRLRVGQLAFVTVDTYPNERFRGSVAYVSDILDPQTRTARVRVEVPNEGTRLKLEMFASVQLPTTFSRMAVAVPTSAIQQVEERSVVFVRKDATKFEAREITIGKTVNELVEVTKGLREGEPVVTQGAFHLKSIIAGKKLGEHH